MMLINGTTALQTQLLARKISDRITITSADLGITTKDYFIERVEHRVSDSGLRHEATFILSRADEAAQAVFWVLGEAGFGELGEKTVLVF